MNNVYILVVIASWSIGGYTSGHGSVVTFQEFNSPLQCNDARRFMENNDSIRSLCIPKATPIKELR